VEATNVVLCAGIEPLLMALCSLPSDPCLAPGPQPEGLQGEVGKYHQLTWHTDLAPCFHVSPVALCISVCLNRTIFCVSAGSAGREGLQDGIADMRRQMSESRLVVEQAADKLRSSFSRPGTAELAAIGVLAGEEAQVRHWVG
jgi:hypothetical protein